MAFMDDMQYRMENWSLYFQGGVRRNILIFCGVSLVLLTPIYFLGGFGSDLIARTWMDTRSIVTPKTFNFDQPVIAATQVVPLINGEKTLYTTISNRTNAIVGFYPYEYTAQILDANGSILDQRSVSTYILPEGVHFAVFSSTDPTAASLRIIEEQGTRPVQYNPLAPDSITNPDITVRNETITDLPDGENIQLRALFKNNSLVTVQRIDIIYILRDTRDSVVGMGTFTFSGFVPGSEREMIVTYPKPAERIISLADIRWSVNYLEPNIVS